MSIQMFHDTDDLAERENRMEASVSPNAADGKADGHPAINLPACIFRSSDIATPLISGEGERRQEEKAITAQDEGEECGVCVFIVCVLEKTALSGRKSGVGITRDLTSGHTRKMERKTRREKRSQLMIW